MWTCFVSLITVGLPRCQGILSAALNRLFIVLTVLWVVFCTVVFPFNERRKASAQYDKDAVSCYSSELGNGEPALHTCLRYAGRELQERTRFILSQEPLHRSMAVGFLVRLCYPHCLFTESCVASPQPLSGCGRGYNAKVVTLTRWIASATAR